MAPFPEPPQTISLFSGCFLHFLFMIQKNLRSFLYFLILAFVTLYQPFDRLVTSGILHHFPKRGSGIDTKIADNLFCPFHFILCILCVSHILQHFLCSLFWCFFLFFCIKRNLLIFIKWNFIRFFYCTETVCIRLGSNFLIYGNFLGLNRIFRFGFATRLL